MTTTRRIHHPITGEGQIGRKGGREVKDIHAEDPEHPWDNQTHRRVDYPNGMSKREEGSIDKATKDEWSSL